MPVTDQVLDDPPPDTQTGPDDGRDVDAQALHTAIGVMRAHYQLAADLIGGQPDATVAYDQSEQLAAVAGELYNGAAALRRAQVHRIWLRDRLSLAALGDMLGISKQRAAQLLSDNPNKKTPRKTTPTEG